MTPTHEQVIEWACQSGYDKESETISNFDCFIANFASIAYAAGRKDEEALWTEIAENFGGDPCDIILAVKDKKQA